MLLGTVGRLIRGSKDALASLGKVSRQKGKCAPSYTSRWGDVVVVGVETQDKMGGTAVCMCA